jgi:two-component system response regulator MprA
MHALSLAAASSNATSRVLVVEDDYRLAAFLDRALVRASYRVEIVGDGEAALAAADARPPDVVVLDVMLPTTPAGEPLDGLEVARQLRTKAPVPILMLTARDGLDDRIAGLDAGADDYLAKPFALEELLARLRALLRGRALAAAQVAADIRRGVLAYADIHVDQDTGEVSRSERRIELRPRAYELLVYFLRHPERVLSRRELLEEVWGYEFLGEANVVEVTVSYLRQMLEANADSRVIHTVRPLGYMLRA